MKRHNMVFALVVIAFLVGVPAVAQELDAVSSGPVEPTYSGGSGGFFYVVMSSGPIGVLNWLGIFIWTLALVPLGVISIAHSASIREKRWPLATKLLLVAPFLLYFLGSFGFFQGVIGGCASLACGPPDVGVLALNISLALYSVAWALFLSHLYLVFFTISFVMLHFSHKKIQGSA